MLYLTIVSFLIVLLFWIVSIEGVMNLIGLYYEEWQLKERTGFRFVGESLFAAFMSFVLTIPLYTLGKIICNLIFL